MILKIIDEMICRREEHRKTFWVLDGNWTPDPPYTSLSTELLRTQWWSGQLWAEITTASRSHIISSEHTILTASRSHVNTRSLLRYPEILPVNFFILARKIASHADVLMVDFHCRVIFITRQCNSSFRRSSSSRVPSLFRWGGLRDEPNMVGYKEERIYEMVACTQTLFWFSFRKSTFSTPNS